MVNFADARRIPRSCV